MKINKLVLLFNQKLAVLMARVKLLVVFMTTDQYDQRVGK
jgi:hypothetical protein